jgi:hypothetical protein
MMLCRFVERDQHFRGKFCYHHEDLTIWFHELAPLYKHFRRKYVIGGEWVKSEVCSG